MQLCYDYIFQLKLLTIIIGVYILQESRNGGGGGGGGLNLYFSEMLENKKVLLRILMVIIP